MTPFTPFSLVRRAVGRLVLAPAAAVLLAGAACADAPAAPDETSARAAALIAAPVELDPSIAPAIDQWASVSAGGEHSCGLTVSGKAYCWGLNSSGQLGSAGGNALRPRAVSAGSVTFRAVSAGETHTCAITTQSAAFCWGAGIGSTPTPVPRGLAYSSISVGETEVCGISPSLGGSAWCWPLGGSPRIVSGAPPFVSISVGADHKCAITAAGDAYCWGANWYGQLGTERHVAHAAPEKLYEGGYAELDAGDEFTCGAQAEIPPYFPGSTNCWGRNQFGQLAQMGLLSAFEPVQMGAYWSRITAGGWHACAMFLTENDHGEVACWGDNISGQVGAGSLHDRIDSPLNVVGGRVYRQVSAGRAHTCALSRYTLSGNVAGAPPGPAVIQCWGRNTSGQLGDLTTTHSRVPVTAIHPQTLVVVRPWPPA